MKFVGVPVADEHLVRRISQHFFVRSKTTVDLAQQLRILLQIADRLGTIADKIRNIDQHIGAGLYHNRHRRTPTPNFKRFF